MVVYRIGRTKWARTLDGEGSRLCGGRWNLVGIPCIYTSESRALAVLEYTVNTNIEDIPRLLSITAIEIPDHFKDNIIASLPGDWRDNPAPSSAKNYGSALLNVCREAVFRFPSSILTQEFNYLLNPLHPDSASFKILDVQDFVYDIRIKAV